MHGNYQNRSGRIRNEIPDKSATPVEAMLSDEPVVDEVDKTPEKTDVAAMVTGCTRLNVREEPNAKAKVVATIPVKSEVIVDLTCSTDEFYKVCNAAGITGFCMRKYISLK